MTIINLRLRMFIQSFQIFCLSIFSWERSLKVWRKKEQRYSAPLCSI